MRSIRRFPWVIAFSVLMTLASAAPGLAAGPGMNGRVVGLDARGLPLGSVANAGIEFKNRAGKVVATTASDRKGAYKVNLSPGTYTFKVQAAGFRDEDAGRAVTLTLSNGYAHHNFSLIRGKTDPKAKTPKTGNQAVGVLHGRVQARGADGKLTDVPAATISLRKVSGKQVTKTNAGSDDPKARGHYAVTLDTGSYQVSVAAPGFETLVIPDAQAISNGKTQTRDFVLAPAKQPDPTGQGIKGAIKFAGANVPSKMKVSIRVLSPGGVPGAVNADDKGAYQRDLRPGRYQVVVEAEGFKTAVSQPRDVLAGKYTVVDLRLAPHDIAVTVAVHELLPGKAGKKAIPGANVLLRKLGDPLSSAPQAFASPDGKANLKVAGPGRYQVLARMKGYKTNGMTIDITEDKHVEIPLVKEASPVALHVRVTDGKGKSAQPIAAAKVTISQNGKTVQSATTDPKGEHPFSLPTGTYHLEVSHIGYTADKSDVTLAAAEVRREIILTRTTTATQAMLKLHIVQRLKSGPKAIAGADIVISQNTKQIVGDKSDKDGKLTLSLAPGPYAVAVTKIGFKTATVPVNLVAAGLDKEIPLEPRVGPEKKSLNLRVVQRFKGSDQPIAGADIAVSQKGKQVFVGKSDPDGKLTVPLSAGTFSLHVAKQGFKARDDSVDITTQDVSKDLVLEVGGVAKKPTLTVHVVERMKSGNKTIDTAITDADIVINQSGKRVAVGKSGPDGKLAVSLAAGTYMVTANKIGYAAMTITVELAMQDVARDIPLVRAAKKGTN